LGASPQTPRVGFAEFWVKNSHQLIFNSLLFSRAKDSILSF
jgi:hypothetical protein